MEPIVSVAIGAGGLGLLYFAYRTSARSYLKFRGKRVVACPETGRPAAVELDAKHAAATALFAAPTIRLQSCSRWPERQDCGRPCLQQIGDSPDGCLVRNMLTAWYHDKSCAICGKPIGEIHWADRKPALMSPLKRTVEWQELQPEAIPAALADHRPVCWNCHIVQTFRREHPELVIDRKRPA